MSAVRVALANLRYAATPEESVVLAEGAIAEAGKAGAEQKKIEGEVAGSPCTSDRP